MKKISEILRRPVSEGLGAFFFSPRRKGRKTTLLYYPVFDDPAEFAYHFHSARYFLPSGDDYEALLFVSPEIKGRFDSEGPPPMPSYFGQCPWGEPAEVEVRETEGDSGLLAMLREHRPARSFVCSGLTGAIVGLVARLGRFTTVDRQSTWGGSEYAVFRSTLQDGDELAAQRIAAHKRFSSYVDSLPQLDKSYVFGTGPSVETAYDYDFSDGYRIVCNTMIKNRRLMEHIRPHFMVAADGIYHFGLSRYSCRFREDLGEFLARWKCLFMLPEWFCTNFVYHHKGLEEFAVPVPYTSSSINLRLKERFEVKTLHNVLNQLLLPLASSLSNSVYLLGFDGRKASDSHFWRSTESVNYEDLKPFHQEAYPGFFRNMDYVNYAVTQERDAEKIISLGESMGKRYISLNESSNSALHRRYSGNRPPA